MDTQNSIEYFIQQRMRKLDLNISELMKQAGLSRTVYYNLVQGKTEQIRLGTVIKLAQVLKVHPVTLLRQVLHNFETISHTKTLYKHDVTGFIQDLTYPDNTLVFAGQTFEKQWEIQNLGREPWIGRRLQCMDSELNNSSSNPESPELAMLQPATRSIEIPTTQPQQHVILSVTFTAPEHPGTVLSYWKMVDAQGRLCFPDNRGLSCQVQIIAL